jgi:hypothetical protein
MRAWHLGWGVIIGLELQSINCSLSLAHIRARSESRPWDMPGAQMSARLAFSDFDPTAHEISPADV